MHVKTRTSCEAWLVLLLDKPHWQVQACHHALKLAESLHLPGVVAVIGFQRLDDSESLRALDFLSSAASLVCTASRCCASAIIVGRLSRSEKARTRENTRTDRHPICKGELPWGEPDWWPQGAFQQSDPRYVGSSKPWEQLWLVQCEASWNREGNKKHITSKRHQVWISTRKAFHRIMFFIRSAV